MIINKHLIDYYTAEDAAMGKFFHGYLQVPMLPNRICFFEDIIFENETEKIISRINQSIINNIDHYRVKSKNNREQIDLYIYNILLKMIYNINP